MTSRKPKSHLKRLFEMFMPEARFPDEKFWTKDGTGIRPSPKGPPKGTTGTTMKDLGAGDDDETPHPATAKRDDLYDHFSKTFPEFLSNIDHASRKLYGNDYQKTIEDFFSRPGYIRDLIKKLWDGNWTDNEALGEIGFIFDVVQQGSSGSGPGASGYSHLKDPTKYYPKEDYDSNSGDMVPRPSRPKGVKNVKTPYGMHPELVY